jgi:hypothetical protein
MSKEIQKEKVQKEVEKEVKQQKKVTPKKICKCGKTLEYRSDNTIQYKYMICVNCKREVCDDCNCGTDTVDGFLCGSYTSWGCARKYTTCDSCMDDKAIHESDLNHCPECGNSCCDKCATDNTCNDCDNSYCDETCLEEHDCLGK